MRFSQIIGYLKTHGRAIGQMAAAGNPRASRIISLYKMVHRLPDPGALGLLEETVNEFARSGELSCPADCAHRGAD